MFPGFEPDGAGVRRQAEPRHVAGSVAVRAPGQGRLQKGPRHSERGPQRPRPDTDVALLAHSVHQQLMPGRSVNHFLWGIALETVSAIFHSGRVLYVLPDRTRRVRKMT